MSQKGIRLDKAVVACGLASTRSQAESNIRLGNIIVNKRVVTNPNTVVSFDAKLRLLSKKQYVSRAGLKLAGVAKDFRLNFRNKIILDIGSSTGGFTDYALNNGAKKVIAIDSGTNQLHHSLREDNRVELHEKTDIRDIIRLTDTPDIILIDVSFISIREILPSVIHLLGKDTLTVAMIKPQFETDKCYQKQRGVIKNNAMRRDILKSVERWIRTRFVILDKSDSKIAGSKGNLERFYLLKATNHDD